MWEKFVKQWTDLVFWWVPRDAPTPEQNEKAQTPSKAEQRTAFAPKPASKHVAEDLTVIKGIGPAVQKKLRGLAADFGSTGASLDRSRTRAKPGLIGDEVRVMQRDPRARAVAASQG